MNNQYSWRDGWALTYPHPIKPKSETEVVSRCLYCGSWVIMNKACNTCGTESK